jgi:hypothetical protein
MNMNARQHRICINIDLQLRENIIASGGKQHGTVLGVVLELLFGGSTIPLKSRSWGRTNSVRVLRKSYILCPDPGKSTFAPTGTPGLIHPPTAPLPLTNCIRSIACWPPLLVDSLVRARSIMGESNTDLFCSRSFTNVCIWVLSRCTVSSGVEGGMGLLPIREPPA